MPSTYPTVQNCAQLILAAYERYERRFKVITRRAQSRFEQRDWPGIQRDAKERLDLYEQVIDEIAATTCEILQERPQDQEPWKQMKNCYSQLIAGRPDLELAETFYNSVTPARQLFCPARRPVRRGILAADAGAPASR